MLEKIFSKTYTVKVQATQGGNWYLYEETSKNLDYAIEQAASWVKQFENLELCGMNIYQTSYLGNWVWSIKNIWF